MAMSGLSTDKEAKNRVKRKAGSHILPGPTVTKYEAYKINRTRRYLMRIGFRPVSAESVWERVNYSQLLRIAEGTDDRINTGQTVTLVFNIMVVILRGKNLQPLANAIDLEHCEYIQQYDPSRWPLPNSDKDTIVESMEFIFPDVTKRVLHGPVLNGMHDNGAS